MKTWTRDLKGNGLYRLNIDLNTGKVSQVTIVKSNRIKDHLALPVQRHSSSGVSGPEPSKVGWSWGCVATVDANGRTIFVANAHRGDGQRFVVHADEKLTAFLELESAIRA